MTFFNDWNTKYTTNHIYLIAGFTGKISNQNSLVRGSGKNSILPKNGSSRQIFLKFKYCVKVNHQQFPPKLWLKTETSIVQLSNISFCGQNLYFWPLSKYIGMLYRVDIKISGVERLTVGLLETEFLLFAFVARWEFEHSLSQAEWTFQTLNHHSSPIKHCFIIAICA